MPSIPSVSRAFADRFKDSLGFSRRGYYRRPNGYQRWRSRLTRFLLFAVPAALLALYFWPGDTMTDPRSHGTVAHVHTAIHNDCKKCHETPAGGNTFPRGLSDIRARWTTFDCTACHAGTTDTGGSDRKPTRAYASHAVALLRKDIESGTMTGEKCGDCHHDHKGENFALARVPDASCTNCHRDLELYEDTILKVAERAGRVPLRVPKNIDDYARHPNKYVSLDNPVNRGKERVLKFSHAQHMSKGIVEFEGQKRDVYLGADGLPGQLQCSSCHQLDNAGAYYRPVKFEMHCAGCHAELLSHSLTEFEGKSLDPVAAPHGIYFEPQLRPKRGGLKDAISAAVLERLLKSDLPDHREPDPPVGKRVDPGFRDALSKKLLPAQADKSRQLIAGLLGAKNCGYCHEIDADRPDIKALNTPSVWLPKARFSHFAHQGPKFDIDGKTCAVCHPNQQATFVIVDPEDPKRHKPDWEKGDIGIPSFATNCLNCHDAKSIAKPEAGTRHDCATCHKYHNHDLGLPATPIPDRK